MMMDVIAAVWLPRHGRNIYLHNPCINAYIKIREAKTIGHDVSFSNTAFATQLREGWVNGR